jgi:hypothetical protein
MDSSKSKTNIVIYIVTLLCLGVVIFEASDYWLKEILYGAGGWDGPGYYIPIAEKFADGERIYNDIASAYTPIGIYALAICYKIFGGGINQYYIVILFAHALTSLIMGFMFFQYSKNYFFSITLSIFYLSTILGFEGAMITMEPFVNIFSVMALLVVQTGYFKKLRGSFLLGIICCFAFLSKQYGIAILPAILACMLIDKSARMNRYVFVIFISVCAVLFHFSSYGKFVLYAVPIFISSMLIIEKLSNLKDCLWMFSYGVVTLSVVMTMLLFLWLAGIDIKIFFCSIFHYGYDNQTSISRGAFYELGWLFLPQVILVLFAIWDKTMNSYFFNSTLIFLIAYLPVLSIRQADHYMLLIIPFVLILSFDAVHHISKKSKMMSLLLVVAFCGAPFLAVQPSELLHQKVPRSSLINLASEVNEYVPPKSRVVLFAYPSLFYYAKLEPPIIGKYSYAYMISYNEDQFIEILDHAEYVILQWNDRDSRFAAIRLGVGKTQENKILEAHGFKYLTTVCDGTRIWKKERTP